MRISRRFVVAPVVVGLVGLTAASYGGGLEAQYAAPPARLVQAPVESEVGSGYVGQLNPTWGLLGLAVLALTYQLAQNRIVQPVNDRGTLTEGDSAQSDLLSDDEIMAILTKAARNR